MPSMAHCFGGICRMVGHPCHRAGGHVGSITLEDIPRVLTLSNLAKLRLDAISFFLACILGSAWAIKLVWNSFAKDFPRLPRISYLRSLGLMGLWGLLFLLVLTMVASARELMTPGAWKKTGLTYELVDPETDELPPTPVAEVPSETP